MNKVTATDIERTLADYLEVRQRLDHWGQRSNRLREEYEALKQEHDKGDGTYDAEGTAVLVNKSLEIDSLKAQDQADREQLQSLSSNIRVFSDAVGDGRIRARLMSPAAGDPNTGRSTDYEFWTENEEIFYREL